MNYYKNINKQMKPALEQLYHVFTSEADNHIFDSECKEKVKEIIKEYSETYGPFDATVIVGEKFD